MTARGRRSPLAARLAAPLAGPAGLAGCPPGPCMANARRLPSAVPKPGGHRYRPGSRPPRRAVSFPPIEGPRRAHGSPGVPSSLLYHGHHGCRQAARLTTGGRTGVTAAQGMCGSLPKFRVIPRECPVEACQLMIICPYPFCNASCKSGLGRPVDLVRRRSLLEGEGRGEVPMMSGSAVRYPAQVQVAPEAARCERSA